jgi:two-component system, cell cycle sensor histidine kinase and response regulator CckA
MLNRLLSWFVPPVLQDNEADVRLARTVTGLALLLLAVQALALAVPIYLGDPLRRVTQFVAFTAVGIATLVCVRAGRVRAGGALLSLGVWGALTYVAVTGYGVYGNAFAAYVVAIMIASLLGGPVSGLVVLGMSVASGLGLALANSRGWLPAHNLAPPAVVWVVSSLVFISCWLAVRLATATVSEALRRARDELSERRHAEAAVAESDARFRHLAEATSEGIGITDGGRIIDANLVLARLLGFEHESELIGRSVRDFVEPSSWETVAERVRLQSSEPYEHIAARRDGTTFPVEARSSMVPLDGRLVRVTAIRDITERRRTDDLLMTVARGVASQTGESFFRSLVAQLAIGLDADFAFVAALQGDGRTMRIVAASGRGELVEGHEYALDGTPCATVLGHPVVIYTSGVAARFPRDLDLARAGVEAYAGASLSGAQGQPAGVLAVMHGRPFDSIGRVESVLRIFAVGAAAEMERGRTEHERRLLEDRLRQSEKLETIGQLAGGVAHDFNNLLSPILGYSEMLLEDMHQDDPRYRQLQFIRDAAEKAASLTRRLLTFSRKQVLDMKPLDLNRAVVDFERILRRTIRESIGIDVRAVAPSAHIEGDAGQIEQILMNLAINGQDAMPRGGQLTIETQSVTLDAPVAELPEGVQPGPYVRLSVTDTGTGMDAEALAHLFEPFFTTKEKGRGTGLGLSTVYGIVRQHRGGIEVHSALGAGTTVRIYLPTREGPLAELVNAPARAAASADAVAPPPLGTVVVVEDDSGVRALTCAILRQRGFHVVEMDGPEACLRDAPDTVCSADLLITDVVMPGMNGRELYERLREGCPSLKVLFISGYADDVLDQVGAGGVPFLQKPFTADGLVSKVREVMGG